MLFWQRWKTIFLDYAGLLAVLFLLILFFGVTTENFLTWTNFRTLANQIPAAILIAVGMTFVLIIAGIDLSVGSVLALSGSMLGVVLVNFQFGLLLSLLACLLTGSLCGLLNGWIIVRWQIPSFIVTLGMLEMARGAAYWVTQSQTLYLGRPVEQITDLQLAGISFPFILALCAVILGQFILTRTIFGRHVVAIGANEKAAHLAGIDHGIIKLVVFSLCGFLSALAAIIDVSRLSSANPNAGIGLELQAIAAVVIGGTSLMGGRGSIISSLLGVLIVTVLGSGLVQLGAQEPLKRLITGAVIILAVILDHYRHRLR
jgi:ribose transport system permease protein